MRNRIVLLSLSAALALASVPVLANKGGQSGAHANAKSATVKTTGPQSTHSPKTTSSPKNTHANKPTTTTSSSGKGASKKTSSTTANASSTTTTGTTSTTTTTNTWTPTNSVATKLSTKSKLLARATSKFGAQNLNLATADFKNFGQFVAAMNVSENLHIDFSQLKAAMTGSDLTGAKTATGTTSSLGQAIQKLKPTVDANAEAAKAESQATAQINADSD